MKTTKRFFLIIPAIAIIAFGFIRVKPASAGVPGSVIINEIMYNPGTGNQNDEYLELYNTTASPIDITGWSFSAGITATFPATTTIPPNGYILVSPSISQTFTTYGATSVLAYAPSNLSNGGEIVTLADETSQVIDTVNYDDVTPWPLSPDGTGPSLELKDPNLDNSDGNNWAASISAPTPGASNSWQNISLPSISSVSDPNNITDADAVTVTATVSDADTVALDYKVMFDSDVTVPMLDDGLSGDGGSGDGTYGATIPAQVAGELVRFKVTATNNQGEESKPSNDDSIDYYGYTVQDPSVTSSAPILQWFMDNTSHTALVNSNNDIDKFPCVFAYGNQVYDSAQIRRKGNNTFYFPKQNYKAYLPSGYTLQMAGAERAIAEFHLNADFRAEQITKVPTLWWVAKEVGMPTPDVITTKLQRNGQFEGMYNLIDKYEKQWRQDNNFNSGLLFEDEVAVTGAIDNTQMLEWGNNMENMDRADPTKRDYVLDNNNIPNLINAMVFPAIINHLDHTADHNNYSYKDNRTGRWSVLHWDFDLALQVYGLKTLATPFDQYPGQYGLRWYGTAVYEQPDLRQMYFRRLRTLVDEMYTNNGFLNKYNELADLRASDITQDNNKWGDPLRITKSSDIASINRLKEFFVSYLDQEWAIPPSQTDQERQSVQISEAVPDALDANEYIKLSNSSPSAVDVSDWTIEGISYTIPKGSVVPGNGSIYILKDDAGYRASHASVIVAGEFANDLGSFGTLILKTNTGQTIDEYMY